MKPQLTKLKALKLVAYLLFVLVLTLDNIKVESVEHALRPIFDVIVYPIGLEQDWNMFVGNQTLTLAVRIQNVRKNGQVSYEYSNMGQKSYFWPNKQRNLDWGLVALDKTGAYRASYLTYLCRHDPSLQAVTFQAAFLNIPTVAQPNYDPFTDTPLYRDLSVARCHR